VTRAAPDFALQRDADRLRVEIEGIADDASLDRLAAGVASPFFTSLAFARSVRGATLELTLAEPADGVVATARTVSEPTPLRLVIELSDEAASPVRDARIRAAVEGVGADALGPCELVPERMLRGQVGADVLTRALTPDGGPYDELLRLGFDRIAELSPSGVFHLPKASGSEALDASDPGSRARAWERIGEVRGLVALLRRAVEGLEPESLREAALHGLFAPALSAERFRSVLANADRAGAICSAHAPRAGAGRGKGTSRARARMPYAGAPPGADA
jgi:hypothetical protein